MFSGGNTAQPKAVATQTASGGESSSRNLEHRNIFQGLIVTLGHFKNHSVTDSCPGQKNSWKVRRGKETHQSAPGRFTPQHHFYWPAVTRPLPSRKSLRRAKALLPAFLNNQICFAATGLNPRDRRSKHISLPVRFFLPLISLSSEAEGQAFSVFLSGKHFSSKESQCPPRQDGIAFPGATGVDPGHQRESSL